VTERGDANSKEAPEFAGLRLLDDLIKDSFKCVSDEFKKKPKLGDWLKMLEVRARLTTEKASNRELWKLLDEVRREVLKNGDKKPIKSRVRRPPTKSVKRTKKDD
jgi:hypothetical protein